MFLVLEDVSSIPQKEKLGSSTTFAEAVEFSLNVSSWLGFSITVYDVMYKFSYQTAAILQFAYTSNLFLHFYPVLCTNGPAQEMALKLICFTARSYWFTARSASFPHLFITSGFSLNFIQL